MHEYYHRTMDLLDYFLEWKKKHPEYVGNVPLFEDGILYADTHPIIDKESLDSLILEVTNDRKLTDKLVNRIATEYETRFSNGWYSSSGEEVHHTMDDFFKEHNYDKY